MPLTVELLSLISLGACVGLAVKTTEGTIVLPVVCVQADVQLSF